MGLARFRGWPNQVVVSPVRLHLKHRLVPRRNRWAPLSSKVDKEDNICSNNRSSNGPAHLDLILLHHKDHRCNGDLHSSNHHYKDTFLNSNSGVFKYHSRHSLLANKGALAFRVACLGRAVVALDQQTCNRLLNSNKRLVVLYHRGNLSNPNSHRSPSSTGILAYSQLRHKVYQLPAVLLVVRKLSPLPLLQLVWVGVLVSTNQPQAARGAYNNNLVRVACLLDGVQLWQVVQWDRAREALGVVVVVVVQCLLEMLVALTR